MQLVCPSCNSTLVKKNGHISNGKQNYRCLLCKRQFVEAPTQKLSVRALLISKNTVLLAYRYNVSFGNGMYSLIGGKVEEKEIPAHQAILHKIEEETALTITENSLRLVHTLHRKSENIEFIILCFYADISNHAQMPYNNKPSKYSNMHFFALNQLPSNTLPAHKQIINCFLNGTSYSEHGW
jgi:8-oxo-dGTP diphosphatase